MKESRYLISIMLATVLVLGIQASSYATPTLNLTDSASNTTGNIADQSGSDSNPTAGIVVYVGGVGSGPWSNNTVTGETAPYLGTLSNPHIDLSSVDNTTAASTLTIKFGEVGFTGPLSNGSFPFLFSVGGTFGAGDASGSTVTFQAYLDPTNTLFGTTDLLGTLGTFTYDGTSKTFGYTGTITGSQDGTITGPFSLTLVAILDLTPTSGSVGLASFNEHLTAVPEPTSLILLGSGLLGAALYRRLRKPKG